MTASGPRPGGASGPRPGGAAASTPGTGGEAQLALGWRRLHPLSPVVRFSRSLLGLVILLGASALSARKDPTSSYVFDLVIVGITLASGILSWIVTRWQVEGTTLRIESGLLRRDSRQVPLVRVQAIDIVQPVVGRLLGLAELRLRVAGSRSEVRLAYLSEAEARATRGRLLALAHGVAADAPAPPETFLISVPTARIALGVALSSAGIVAALTAVTVVGLAVSIPGAAGFIAGSGVAGVIALLAPAVRQVTSEGGFALGEAPDGLRVRCGLIETVAETIPRGRVQAVRRVEPLLWRPLGWCRLEVMVAGSRGHRRRDEPAGRVVRALLPVGSRRAAEEILARVLPGITVLPTQPPARARWKAPLSFHFLGGGHDGSYAVTSWGRLCRVTAWVPLAKVQSLRFVQGPWQRRLSLASVHLDVAGRRLKATFRDRGLGEAQELVGSLAELCRRARSPAGAAQPP